MKRAITIISILMLTFAACFRTKSVHAPLSSGAVRPNPDLEKTADSMRRDLFSRIYKSEVQAAKKGAIYYAPQKSPQAVSAIEPVRYRK